MDKEIIFLVEEAPEGGYVAKALGHSIDEIKTEIRDAIRCHFSEDELPRILRLHFVKEEVIAI